MQSAFAIVDFCVGLCELSSLCDGNIPLLIVTIRYASIIHSGPNLG